MLTRLPASLVALFSLTAAVAAIPADWSSSHGIGPRAATRKCGNEPSLEVVNQMEAMFADLLAEKQASRTTTRAAGDYTVPVYFNVIYTDEDKDAANGDIPDDQIAQQMDVMNNAFSGTGLSFVLQDTIRTLNTDWFNNVAPDTDKQTQMKKQLRQGGPSTLNVYTVGFNNDGARGLLGYATFPATYSSNPDDDGIVLHYATLPGGSQEPYNKGQTLTHEVGHWVGLYHTFQDGCDGGDQVDDTPAEAEPSSGCPEGRNTCPNRTGVDPIHNYMDYSDDACLTEFTPGQIVRLKNQISTFRGITM